MGKTFEELMYTSPLRPSTFGKPIHNAEDDEETSRDEQSVMKENNKARKYENAIDTTVAKNLQQKKENIAQWGTDDPRKIAAIQATGAFAPNLAQRMTMDPEGTRASVERAAELAGKGGVQDFPDTPDAEPERDYYRENEKGTLEFTNRPELAGEGSGFRRYNSDGGSHKDLGAPGGGVGRIGSGEEGGPVDKRSPEDILFEGKLDAARTVVDAPEKAEERAKTSQRYFDELWEKHEDIKGMRAQIQEDWFSGAAKKRGLRSAELKTLDALILKRGKNSKDMRDPGIDKTFFKPFAKSTRTKMDASDLAEPATVLNPDGQTPESTKVQQGNYLATQDAASSLEATMPKQTTTAYQYANGMGGPAQQGVMGSSLAKPTIGSTLAAVSEPGMDTLDPGAEGGKQSDIGRTFGLLKEKGKRKHRETHDEQMQDPSKRYGF